MLTIRNKNTYRSSGTTVNKTDDMTIIVIVGKHYEVREMLRCLEENEIYFTKDVEND